MPRQAVDDPQFAIRYQLLVRLADSGRESPLFTLRVRVPLRSLLWLRFEDHIERRVRGTAKPRKSAL
jgi:hypothetical protein